MLVDTSKCMFFNPLRQPQTARNGFLCAFPCFLSILEETMERKKLSIASASVAALMMTLALGVVGRAQDQTQEPVREATSQSPEQQRLKADGERHGLPVETFGVAQVTKFLVRLEGEFCPKDAQGNGT